MFDFGIISIRKLTPILIEVRVRRGLVGSLGYRRPNGFIRWI